MPNPPKEYDVCWCWFFGPVFVVLGLLELARRPSGFAGYGLIGVGLAWLVKGLVRRRKKKQAFERDGPTRTNVA